MFEIFITLLLVFLNGFFVASEFAIVKVRSSQIELKVKLGHRRAILSKHIVKHLDGYLAATQLGITLASLGLGWIGEPVVSKIIISIFDLLHLNISAELAHNIALPVAFAVITILHIVFGELAPKSIAIQKSEATTLWIAFPLQLFYIIFRPFIWILNGIANALLKVVGISAAQGSEVHSSEELKYIVHQGKESGVIEESDYDIIKNAFDFPDRTVKQIMIPVTLVVFVDVNNFNDAILKDLIEEGYSRIPCIENTPESILGIVYLKDLLLKSYRKEHINIRELIRPVLVVPEVKLIGSLLKEFQKKHQQLAVVVDEYGQTAGIISMEDILEELVGEIQDEYDNEAPVVEKTGDKTYAVVASAKLDDINELLPHSINGEEQYDTLAGNIFAKTHRIPNSSEKITLDNYEITILKKIKSSIVLVQLRDLAE